MQKANERKQMNGRTIHRRLKLIGQNKSLYIMLIPVIAYYAIFHYWPMYGAIIAFKDFSPGLGITQSPWANPLLKHFRDFFGSFFFGRLLRNTILISVYNLVFSFPFPIILAILINELRFPKFKRTVQTLSYLPHFISMVVICGIILDFTLSDGVINQVIIQMGGKAIPFLQRPQYFRGLYTITGILQSAGWSSIIYLSALAGIDQSLFEAAKVDGANRFQQIIHITLPGIMPTIITLLILQIGNMLNVGYEKIILLYNPAIYETADVISTYVYRNGLENFNWSFSTAVGLFNSVINMVLVLMANTISRQVNDASLW